MNAAAVPESLFESELFGYEKGAFTGAAGRRKGKIEEADGGTLFLDEIAEIPLPMQAKLLRVIQEREFQRLGGTATLSSDFRLIAATHRDLSAEVAAGRFREDLYFRIAVLDLEVPALRERISDIPLLTAAFVVGFFSGVWALLQTYFNVGASSAKMANQVPLIFGNEPWQRMQSWMSAPTKPEPMDGVAIVFGLFFTIILMIMRLRIVGWPFHPVGYAISTSWGMHKVWMPLFIAWLAKRLIIRYGGLKLYRQAIPFFLGLILGDFTSGAIFNIIGVIWTLPVYHFLG